MAFYFWIKFYHIPCNKYLLVLIKLILDYCANIPIEIAFNK